MARNAALVNIDKHARIGIQGPDAKKCYDNKI